jgi:hypothetical protein
MSDYNSSLPVRTENAGDVIAKIADATVTSQQLAVNADGSINITDNSGSLTVDAVNLDIRDLSHSQDSVKIGDGTDFLAIDGSGNIGVTDAGGSLTVDASNLDIRDLVFATDKVDVSGSTVALDAPTLAALESITVQNGAGGAAVNIQDGGNSITVDGTVTANQGTSPWVVGDGGGSLTVDATDLDIRDLSHSQDSVKIGDGTDFLAINADGSINVALASTPAGDEVNDYNTAASLAANATSNHDYTVTAGKTLTLRQIEASSSGKMKIEVRVETSAGSGTFVTKFVQFNSTANPNMSIHLESPISVAAGVKVRVARTNRDGAGQDVYSTISGQEN